MSPLLPWILTLGLLTLGGFTASSTSGRGARAVA